jgi:beta-lactamase class A
VSAFALLATAALLQSPADSLRDAILDRIARDSGATVAVVLRDPVQGFFVAVNPDLRFHAASTMKIPVLLELGRRVDARELGWTDSIPVHNRFESIVDGSAFSLDRNGDGDTTVYASIGGQLPLRQLATRMIVRSSNLATNLLIEKLGAAAVTATIRRLGADSMVVLRGVEDGKAFAAGRNNTTTARDLATLLLALADRKVVSSGTTAELLRILEAQEFNDGIPAGLPAGTRVAHKTGEITATWHDAALVFPAEGPPYTLVVLTRGVRERARGVALQADIAALAHRAVLAARVRSRGRTPGSGP